MILKICDEDGYVIYDNLSRVSVKTSVKYGSDEYKKLREHTTLVVSPGEPQDSDSIWYHQIWARSKMEGDMLFLVNTIAYLCNDSGKTVETIRPGQTKYDGRTL